MGGSVACLDHQFFDRILASKKQRYILGCVGLQTPVGAAVHGALNSRALMDRLLPAPAVVTLS